MGNIFPELSGTEAKEEVVAKLEEVIRKQKKRVEELEDDLETAEDTVKKTRKKLDENTSEKNALQTELNRIKNEHEKNKGELELIKQNLEFVSKDLSAKKRSIDFVNEILNAKESSDQRTVEIAEKTQAIRDFVRDSIGEIFREIYEDGKDIADMIDFEMWKWVNLQRKTWLKDKKIIAFIGEFSAGKTSIVNRIFTRDRKDPSFTLPTSRGATTAVATYISYGNNTKVQFTDPVGELRELAQDTFLQFTKDSLENISVSRLVAHFVNEYNNKNLQRLSILDTPGFSSGDQADENRTIAVINEADTLFWVLDANTGDINTTSMGIIKEHVKDIPLYVVVNKVDTLALVQREQIETKIRSTIAKAKIPVKGFIQFSQKEPLEVLTKVIDAVQPRRPDYDVIKDINERLDNGIKYYKGLIKEEKKKVSEEKRGIDEAENIIEAFDHRFDLLEKRFFHIQEEMFDKDKRTWLGDIKIKVLDEWNDKQIKVIEKILQLYGEYAGALETRVFSIEKKSDSESTIKECKEKQKHLEGLRKKFGLLLKDFSVETQYVSSSGNSQDASNEG
jgi:GTPase SAR1 family protein